MGFSPTFSVMPFVSAELIHVLLAKLIPHSPFSSCGVWDGWFMAAGKPETLLYAKQMHF